MIFTAIAMFAFLNCIYFAVSNKLGEEGQNDGDYDWDLQFPKKTGRDEASATRGAIAHVGQERLRVHTIRGCQIVFINLERRLWLLGV